MNLTETKGFAASELCEIITACAAAGVSKLKIPGMRVEFGTTVSAQGIETFPQGIGATLPEIPGTDVDHKAEDQIQNTFVEAMQSRMDEEIHHAQRLMDDPVGFEDDLVDKVFNPEVEPGS